MPSSACDVADYRRPGAVSGPRWCDRSVFDSWLESGVGVSITSMNPRDRPGPEAEPACPRARGVVRSGIMPPPAQPRTAPDCGRSLSTAKPCAARAPTSPGRSPCSPRWTTPVMSWPRARSPTKQRVPRLPAPARQRRPDQHGHHRRRPAHPARPRHLPPRARCPLHRPGRCRPSRPLRPRPPSALARDHARPPRPHPGPSPPGDPTAEDHRLRSPPLSRRTSGPPSRSLGEGLHERQAHHRARLPDHQPAARRGHRRPARRLDQRALEDRKPSAPRPRPDVPRGRLQDPCRPSPAHHGRPAQPRHRRPPSRRPHQHRRRPTSHRPRLTKAPGRPRPHRMKPGRPRSGNSPWLDTRAVSPTAPPPRSCTSGSSSAWRGAGRSPTRASGRSAGPGGTSSTPR